MYVKVDTSLTQTWLAGPATFHLFVCINLTLFELRSSDPALTRSGYKLIDSSNIAYNLTRHIDVELDCLLEQYSMLQLIKYELK